MGASPSGSRPAVGSRELPERDAIKAHVCSRTKRERCKGPSRRRDSIGLSPKEGQCGLQGPRAGTQLELGAEESERPKARTVSRPLPEGSLDLAGGDPLPSKAEVTAEVTKRSKWARHRGQNFPYHCGRAQFLAETELFPNGPRPHATPPLLTESCLDSRAFTWAGSVLEPYEGQL